MPHFENKARTAGHAKHPAKEEPARASAAPVWPRRVSPERVFPRGGRAPGR